MNRKCHSRALVKRLLYLLNLDLDLDLETNAL